MKYADKLTDDVEKAVVEHAEEYIENIREANRIEKSRAKKIFGIPSSIWNRIKGRPIEDKTDGEG